MTELQQAAQQALKILDSEFTTVDGEFCRWCDGRLNAKHNCALEQTITALHAALAEPVQEPSDMAEQLADALDSAQFYRRRCEAIQAWQSKMRDPERVIVCDILANGKTLDPAVAGDRYTVPRPAEPVQGPREFDNSLGADRFKVVRRAFWWHVLIGDSTTEHGKFYSRASAEKMAFDLLREFRNGAFVQHEAIRARGEK